MAPNLDTLPSELLELVRYCCTSPADWSALRLTCRSLQSATRRGWAKKFFSGLSIGINVAQSSSLKLSKFSKVQDLAETVSEVTIYCPDDRRFTHCSRFELLEASQVLVSLFYKIKNAKYFTFMNVENASDRYRPDRRRVSSPLLVFRHSDVCNSDLRCKARTINSAPDDITTDEFELLDFTGLPRMRDCFSELEEFQTQILMVHGDIAEDINITQLGRQMSDACNKMHALSHLSITFAWTLQGQTFFHELASSVSLPCLEKINFVAAMCHTCRLVEFVHQHKATLKILYLTMTLFSEEHPQKFQTLLEEVWDCLNLDESMLNDPWSPRGEIGFQA